MKQAALKGLIVGLLWGVTIVSLPLAFQAGAAIARAIDPPKIWLTFR